MSRNTINNLGMLSIRDEYRSLVGMVTIRKLDGKYIGMEVGDHVMVNHGKDPKDTVAIAREWLRVRAMAVADLDTLARAHGYNTVQGNPSLVKEAAEKFYGKDNLDGDFIAIYFD